MTTPTPGATGAQDEVKVEGQPTPGDKTGAQDNQDAGIQKAINAIVARERKEREKLEQEVAELRKQATATTKPDEFAAAVRKPLEERLAEMEAKERQRVERLVVAELKAAVADAVDPDLAADLLKGHVKPSEDGALEVVDAEGRPRYGVSGPMTLAELKAELYAKRAYLAPATARSGIGVGHAPAAPVPSGDSIPDLKAAIAALEAKGEFIAAQPLKTKLSHLVSKR